jgi:hypothetical protein
MKQLHDRTVFVPIHVNDLTREERIKAMASLIFLVEKRDGTIKARHCANGSTQRSYMSKEESSSPTVLTESVIITSMIEAKEKRDVMTSDIPNAFCQTPTPPAKVGERIIMKITGELALILVKMDPATYQDYLVYEGKSPVLYVQVLRAIYGMLISGLLFYKKLRKDLESVGFKINPYDPCVANRMVNGKQHTVTWHVDDLKSSHMDSKVNDEFHDWLQKTYGDDHKPVKSTRGKRHDYLAMNLVYHEDGTLEIDMIDYVKGMVDEFSQEVDALREAKYPWDDNLFQVDPKQQKNSLVKIAHNLY